MIILKALDVLYLLINYFLTTREMYINIKSTVLYSNTLLYSLEIVITMPLYNI